MTSPTPEEPSVFGEALRRWNAEQAEQAPAVAGVLARIFREPSPVASSARPARSANRSARLAAELIHAQGRVVPGLVAPAALISAAMAVLLARFLGGVGGAEAADAGFAGIVLAGVVVTATLALSRPREDAISLATPVGPQLVVMARIALVLLVDATSALVASAATAAFGYGGGLAELLPLWVCPMAFVAGTTTFLALWLSPAAGVVGGLLLGGMAAPLGSRAFALGWSGLLWRSLGPGWDLACGALVLMLAIASARRAAVVGPRVS